MWADDLAAAARLAQSADPAAAGPAIGRLLSARPGDADALTLAGIVAQRLAESDAAIEAFAKARDADPGNPARHGNLAVALKTAGRFEDAIAAFRRALDLRPDHAATLANLGSCLLAAGRPEEALTVLGRVPAHADALNNMGVAHARLGDNRQAAACYRKALALKPEHGAAALNLVDALSATGEGEAAEALARRILEAAPDHPRAANQLGMLRDRAGDAEGAIAAFGRAWKPDAPNHALGVNLARALLVAGRPEEALDVAVTLSAASPSVTTPLALRCAALERLGRAGELAALMGVDRFVEVIDIGSAPGFATMEHFNRALVTELRAHPSLTFEPAGLVTRKGRQSGDLAGEGTPALAALATLARERLDSALRRLGRLGHEARDHPFLAAMPERWDLTLWGTLLSSGGAVEPHIHAPNWLSGVYYPDFPEQQEDGAFAIGTLPAELGGGGSATVLRPRTGRMILFPSYLWHATLPFSGPFSGSERVSFAFDLVPEGIGRAHSPR